MTRDRIDENTEVNFPLGSFFRDQREAAGHELTTVQQQTRIPPKTLEAIEADDFDALPREPFAKGFYRIYAQYLDLDVDAVLQQYDEQSCHKQTTHKPKKTDVHKQTNSMASQPAVRPMALIGFSLVLLVIIGALVSWFVAWNPASYVSNIIRSEEQQLTQNQTALSPIPVEQAQPRYHLQAHFPTITKVTIITDDKKPENFLFQPGDTRSWMAMQKITMILPEKTKVRLTLNGLLHPLPPPQYGMITVKIPIQ